jgi:hypothetical protein
MKYSLKDLLDDHQTGHSEFQDDYMITIRAGGNLYGQYKQALRELYKRVRGHREASCDLEITQLTIDEYKDQQYNGANKFEKRRAAIERRRAEMQLEEGERVIKDNKRELIRFYQQACQLKEEIGELTPEKRKTLDYDMWMEQFKGHMAVDLFCHGTLRPNTFEAITALPLEMKMNLLAWLGDRSQHLLEWYQNNHNAHHFQSLPILDQNEFKLLEDGGSE